MRIDEIGGQACSVAKALDQIGDAWSFLIIREAFYGRRRFSDFVRHTGAQKTVVSARLKNLVEAQIMDRVEYSEYPSRHEYVLTEKGIDLAPMLLVLTEWGDRWIEPERGRRVEFVHACGDVVDATVDCGSCGDLVHAAAIIPRVGPGYPRGIAPPFANAPGERDAVD